VAVVARALYLICACYSIIMSKVDFGFKGEDASSFLDGSTIDAPPPLFKSMML
jgi:hypothetical protein